MYSYPTKCGISPIIPLLFPYVFPMISLFSHVSNLLFRNMEIPRTPVRDVPDAIIQMLMELASRERPNVPWRKRQLAQGESPHNHGMYVYIYI